MNKLVVVSILAIAFSGCASTKSTVSKNYISHNDKKISLTIIKDSEIAIPADQYQLLESQIRDGLTQNGLLSTNEDIAQHSAIVTIHSFRMRPDAARLAVGILAGCDNIKSTVAVTDISTREEIGSSQISINECAAWGTASQVIKKYTDGVVANLSKK